MYTAASVLWPVLAAALAVYLAAALRQRRRRGWSAWRAASFAAGIGLLAVATSPWVTHAAHRDLRVHMAQHLLLAMFAPLALVLSAPMTLLLRTLPARAGRRVAGLLRSRPLHLLTRPTTVLVLDSGGLLLLYLTPLFASSLADARLHGLVLVHFLAAGYLFAWSVAGPDPARSRAGMRERLGVLAVAIAVHSTLAKSMYAHAWPQGTPFDADQIRAAAKVMYYGGDVAELLLAVALFADWYRAGGDGRYRLRSLPRRRPIAAHGGSAVPAAALFPERTGPAVP